MVTGDHPVTARAIARSVNIMFVFPHHIETCPQLPKSHFFTGLEAPWMKSPKNGAALQNQYFPIPWKRYRGFAVAFDSRLYFAPALS
jgi:magnesium-transporting ATPase (P-type)